MKILVNLALFLFILGNSLYGKNPKRGSRQRQRILETILHTKAEVFKDEGVIKVSFPRKDIKLKGTTIAPFMGTTSWISFQEGKIATIESMAMGDLVLFEDEVNTVMDSAFKHDFQVTALHNHFFFDSPKTYFMHISFEGKTKLAAQGIKSMLDTVAQIRAKKPVPSGHTASPITKSTITGSLIDTIFGISGTTFDGMHKVVIGRKIRAGCGCTIGKNMGINTWAAFSGTDDNALVLGDFAVLEDELQPVLKALRQAGITIVAMHNHMTHEQPRMLFLHYMGQGKATDLAKGIKRALSLTH